MLSWVDATERLLTFIERWGYRPNPTWLCINDDVFSFGTSSLEKFFRLFLARSNGRSPQTQRFSLQLVLLKMIRLRCQQLTVKPPQPRTFRAGLPPLKVIRNRAHFRHLCGGMEPLEILRGHPLTFLMNKLSNFGGKANV